MTPEFEYFKFNCVQFSQNRQINILEFYRVWNLSTKTRVFDFKSSQRKGPTVPQFYAKVACYIKPINDFWLEAIEEREINHVWIWMHFDYWQDARRVPLLLPKMKKEDENLPHNSLTTETQCEKSEYFSVAQILREIKIRHFKILWGSEFWFCVKSE